MKAKPVKIIPGEGYVGCPIDEATHVTINMPGPVGRLTLPMILRGKREGTGCWTWNGDMEHPTLKPSLLTSNGEGGWRCHTWVNDGKAQFLPDTSHELVGKTVDLLEVD